MGLNPQALTPVPEKGRIVTADVLRSYQALDWRSFAGETNPSRVWQQMLSDSTSAFKFYRDIEEKDLHVAAMLDVRKDAVLRRKHQIVAASDAPEDKQRAEFVIEALGRLGRLEEILDELMDAPAYGLSLGEILWEEADGRIWAKDIVSVPQEFFRFGDRLDSSQTGILRFVGPWDAEDREMPESKFLIFTYRPRNGNRRGRPLLRGCFWFSWAKRQLIKFMLQQAEKPQGTVAVQYPPGASDAEKTKALEAGEAIVDERAVAIPENFKIVEALLTGVQRGSVPDYLQRIEKLDSYITRRVLGQTLTTQGSEAGAGSRALGEVHEEVKFDKAVADAERLERVLNEQLIRRLMLFNFGPGVPLPKWEIEKSPPVNQSERIRIDAQLVSLGVPIPLRFAKKTYGIPEAQPGDETLRTAMVPVELLPGEQP